MDDRFWHSCSKGERYRYISTFMHLEPGQLTSLSARELMFLLQWIFELQERRIVQVDVQKEHFDLMLFNRKEKCREYARFYPGDPIMAVYKLITELQGQSITKMYLFTLGRFCLADKSAQKQSPLCLELRDSASLFHLVQAAQTNYGKMLHTKPDYYVIPEPFSKREAGFEKLWSEFKKKTRPTPGKLKDKIT